MPFPFPPMPSTCYLWVALYDTFVLSALNNNNNSDRRQCLAPIPWDGVIPAQRGLSLPFGAGQ